MERKWDPALYKKTASNQHRLALDCIENFLSFQGNETILDVGCGEGFITEYLANKIPNGNILGTDQSQEMIDFANENYHLNNLTFKCLAAEAIDFDSSFDYVVSFSCLQWVKEQLEVLQKVYKSLKPGGKILFILWPWTEYYYNPAEFVIKTEKWQKRFANFKHGMQSYDISGYRILLRVAGFEILHLEHILDDFRYATLDEYANVIKSFLPHLAYLKGQEQQEFLKDVLQQFSRMTGKDEQGHYYGPARHLVVYAKK